MRRALSLFVLSCLWVSQAEAAAEKRVVAVLYFDNNTGKADFDILKKGFADMMVTDLASVSALQVVERSRLEDVLSELKLQKTKYFDPKTAVRIGKGLGARYAVTGAFAAFSPKMRIDIRMIEIATGKVVLADKVVGNQEKLFELQAELVAKFVKGLEVEQPAAVKSRRVPNVDTLLEYSKSVDLADKGQLDDAAEALKKLVRKHPTFVLARAKQAELRKRLAEAKSRRAGAIAASGASLEKIATAHLETNELDLSNQGRAKTYLAYRIVRGAFLFKALELHLTPREPVYVMKGHEKSAYRLLRAIHANGERLVDEVDRYAKAYEKTLPGGQVFLDGSFSLPPGASAEAVRAGMDSSFSSDRVKARRTLAEMLLLGRVHSGKKYKNVGPVLSSIDRALEARGYALLETAYEIAKANYDSAPRYEYDAIAVLDAHANALLLRDQNEAAIGKLQRILDDFPTSRQFARYEKKIQAELGMKYDHSRSTYAGFIAAFDTCKDMEFRKGLGGYMGSRVRLYGRQALPDLVAEVEKHCMGKPKLKRFWPYLYMHVGLFAGTRGDCEMFEAMVKKYLAAGGSTSDLKGYRKNYAKTCK